MKRPKRAAPSNPAPAPAVVIVDARCLQDPDYAPRGVGRHAITLLQGVRPGAARLVALTDPLLPPLTPDATLLFEAVATNAYAARQAAHRLGGPAAYIALSPMTHDPLFGARFLGDDTLLRTAVVYDFIPLRHPERYLATASADLGYALRLFWLSQCDRFVPISQSAADDLVKHLQVDRASIRVSGAPLTDWHAEDRSAWIGKERRGILVVGGGDPRKNPETVIRAHSRCKALQLAGTMLTVAGNYGPEQVATFKALALAEGGRAELVHVPGHIPEADLVALYRGSAVVVCASMDEGFSLPVIEGMAAGALVLASDIPAHRELVPHAAHLFPVDDAGRLADLLGAVDWTGATAAGLIEAQDEVWPRFRASHVSERFWAFATPAPRLPAPSLGTGAKPRIAVLSPLPPDRTGVGDYTHATCLELGRLADLHMFTETERPGPVPGVAAVLPLTDLPGLSPHYDRTVSVLGNSRFHTATLEHLERYGGASIAHDARMLQFYFSERGPQATADLAARELNRPVSVLEVSAWLEDEGRMETTFLSDIAAASTPMIVHSPVTQTMMRANLGIETTHLPFCIYHPFEAATLQPARRRAARTKLGVARDEVLLATFGHVDSVKGPEDCLWALERLRSWGVNASLHFVGQCVKNTEISDSLASLAERLGLGNSVRFYPEYLGEDVYFDYLLAADVAIQVRRYGLGGLSGALLDCAGAGLPCVANQSLFDAVSPPPAYTAAVPDVLSPVLLAERVADLVGVRGARKTEATRLAFCDERSLARYAKLLMAALGLPS